MNPTRKGANNCGILINPNNPFGPQMNATRYLLGQMFNGLVHELREAGIECETATRAITKSDDSRIGIADQMILEYLRGEGLDSH